MLTNGNWGVTLGTVYTHPEKKDPMNHLSYLTLPRKHIHIHLLCFKKERKTGNTTLPTTFLLNYFFRNLLKPALSSFKFVFLASNDKPPFPSLPSLWCHSNFADLYRCTLFIKPMLQIQR